VEVTVKGDPEALHEGLIALLAAILAASVFTIGFLSTRSHAALRTAKQQLELGGRGADASRKRREDHARGVVEDARSVVVLGVNCALVAVVVLVILISDKAGIEKEGWITLIGLLLVEVTIVVLGVYDHVQVGKALKTSMAVEDEPPPQPQRAKTGDSGDEATVVSAEAKRLSESIDPDS
jgi:hypothetical protein